MKKMQAYWLVGALALAACSDKPAPAPAQADAKPVAPASAPPPPAADDPTAGDPALAAQAAKAKELTQEQIQQSRNPQALAQLGLLYEKIHDTQHQIWTLEQLIRLLPNDGDVRFKLAEAYASLDDKSHAYDALLRLSQLGYSYDIARDPAFGKISDTRVWQYLVEVNDRNGQPFGEGKVAFDLPKGDTLLESLAWDGKRKRFLVGSLREGKIYTADEHGKLAPFIAADADNGLLAVFGLAVDAAHDRLYAIANGVPQLDHLAADQVGVAGVFEFDLGSGKFLHKYLVPRDPRTNTVLTSLAVDDNGHVFAADGVNNAIWRLDGGELKSFARNPALTGIRGIALSGDGRTLYFADATLGIFGFDLARGAPFDLAHDIEHVTLGGITGLYWYDGALAIIQGGMSPQRVMRLRLAGDGRSVMSAAPLDAAQPAFSAPTTGTVAGEGLYFIANSQKSLYSALGVLTAPDKLEAVRVFRSNLRYEWDAQMKAAPAKRPAIAPEMLRAPGGATQAPPGNANAPLFPAPAETPKKP